MYGNISSNFVDYMHMHNYASYHTGMELSKKNQAFNEKLCYKAYNDVNIVTSIAYNRHL